MYDIVAALAVGWCAGQVIALGVIAWLERQPAKRLEAWGQAFDEASAAAETALCWFGRGCQVLSWAIFQGKDPYRIR